MIYHYGYEAQKLSSAIRVLVTARSIQERLGHALIPLTIIATQGKSPIRERVEEIMTHMNIPDPVHGSIIATCRTMSDERAERFAEELFTLYTWVTEQNAMENPSHTLRGRTIELD